MEWNLYCIPLHSIMFHSKGLGTNHALWEHFKVKKKSFRIPDDQAQSSPPEARFSLTFFSSKKSSFRLMVHAWLHHWAFGRATSSDQQNFGFSSRVTTTFVVYRNTKNPLQNAKKALLLPARSVSRLWQTEALSYHLTTLLCTFSNSVRKSVVIGTIRERLSTT